MDTKTISLLMTDVKTRKLIGVNREIMEETLRIFNISAKVLLVRRSNAMWDILLPTEDAAAKSLAWDIFTTKSLRLQTGCREMKVALNGAPLYITEGHLGFSCPNLKTLLMSRR